MNILYYALPCFLIDSEVFKYSISHLKTLLNYSKLTNINPIIIKEKLISNNSLKDIIPEIPEIKSLDFSLNNNYNLIEFVNKNNIDIYHCFHNGFSLCENFNAAKISTIYTTLPLTSESSLDNSYYKMYLDRVTKTLNFTDSIIVPYNFMKKDLCNFFSINNKKIHVIPPVIPFNLINKSKPLSKIYVKSKFNITGDYYIYIGEINPRNTLIDTLKLFKYYSNNSNVKLILSLTYLNKNKYLYYELISFIDRINLTSKVIFLNSLNYDDFINLINSSICFINLNPFNELNITTLYALFLNTNILAYQTYNNLEFLEDYPIYISNYIDAYDIDLSVNNFEKISTNTDEIYSILNKFHIDGVFESFYNIYQNIL
ncbi:glycosyltransferase [Clostridium weizhouense]|uniref:Glycosyltransferase n=1 Tax=Clostridium weizhouense TaxID=2859781 RepID=A0ABS7AKS6_9CLOT|nr:glycosyltransferase [Clostridium weizhouense]MBW6409262.1 glycosyltransferase [Clostridium weizhouense]